MNDAHTRQPLTTLLCDVHRSARWHLAGLIVLLGTLYCFSLDVAPLWAPDEGRYAEIPREMLASGDWVTPTLNGVPYFEKPPLVYWTVAMAMRVFGSHEWALRLVPAGFAVIGVLLTYVAGRRLYGSAVALAGAVVLGTSLLYFALSQLLLLDMVLAVLVSAALFGFVIGIRTPPGPARRFWFYSLYLAAALATLTKGLIGFLLPGAVMFAWLLLFNQWRQLRPFYLPTGLALFLAVAAPWHIAVALRNPEWADFYLVHEHWLRFTTTVHGRYQPWWFFAPIVVLGLFPWTGFIVSGLRHALPGGWTQRQQSVQAWFLVVWIAVIFLFFSKSQSKLIPYILPIFPPLALIAGIGVVRTLAGASARAGVVMFAALGAVLTASLVAAAFVPKVLRSPDQFALVRPYLFTLAAVFAIGVTATIWLARTRAIRSAATAIVLTATAGCAVLVRAAPAAQRPGIRPLAEFVRVHVSPAAPVFHYRAFFHDFTFYARRAVGLVEYQDELELQFLPAAQRAARFVAADEFRRRWSNSERIYVVVRKDKLHELHEELAVHGERTGDSAPATGGQSLDSVNPPPADTVIHVLQESGEYYLVSNHPDADERVASTHA